jgi:DNA-binding LacI/PurR family transcriptional regulator
MVHEIPGHTYDLVRSNLFADGEMLAEYLIKKQYNNCIYLSDAKRDEVAISPLINGLSKKFREYGISFGLDQTRLFENPHSYGVRKDPCIDSYNFVKQLLTRERPRVIIAGHDWCAMGAIRAIQDSGLSIPGEIAVVSAETVVDLSTITSTPTITGIDTLLHYRAKMAAEILKRRLEGDDRPVVYHEIHGKIQEGETA